MPAVRGPVHSALALAAHKELRQWRGTPTLASGRRPSNRHYPSSTWGGRRPRRTRAARPHGAPGHHAQAARRSGVPRVRHRRVQAGQVVAGQRPAERAGLPRRRRHRHLRPHRHPLRRPAVGRRAVRSGRRPVRPRPRADPRGHRGRPGGQLRHRGGRSCRRAAGELGRGRRCPASCSATASSSSTRPASVGSARPTAPPRSAPCRWPTPSCSSPTPARSSRPPSSSSCRPPGACARTSCAC